MTKPFEGARLLIVSLVAFVVFVCLAGCVPPDPHLIPPMCETPLGPVPCGVQKP